MKDLALECPVPFMETLVPLTDFDFILAHLWDTIPGYKDWYTDRGRTPERTVILDNGTNELGFPVSLKEMDRVASQLDPDFIVPPDFLGEGDRTIESLKEGISIWGREKLIPVVQGSDKTEVLQSFRQIRRMGFEIVSVPYDLSVAVRSTPLHILAETRKTRIAQMLETEESDNPTVKFHLLGLNTLEEIFYYRKFTPEVVSLDTGAPFLNASLGIKFGRDRLISKGVYIDYSRPKDQYPEGTVNLAQENIRYLKGLMNGQPTD